MRYIFFLTLLLFMSFHAKGEDRVWKKLVSRVIDTRTVHSRHCPIARAIIDAVRSGKATVYSPIDNDFTKPMDHYELMENIAPRPDTITLVDPVDGREVIKTMQRQINPDSIHMYRIMEEWTFNPVTGKINIQVKYIAPMQNLNGDDGIFRGRRLLFWMSYKDFTDALQKSKNAKKQERIFYNSLWQSYFEPFPAKRNKEQWEGYAKSLIDLTEPEDTAEHYLRDENADSSLSMQIANEFEKDKLPLWSHEGPLFSKQLTKTEFTGLMYPVLDTQVVIDPIDGHEVIKVSQRNIMWRLSDYYILQHWALNPKTGKTEIIIPGIAPVLSYSYDEKGNKIETLYRVRYADLQPLLKRIEQYHPTNTFAMHIWDSFFLSDTKPVLISN